MKNKETGWVYAMSNESIPDMLKVGATTKTVIGRARELSNATGVPSEFYPEIAILSDDVWNLESEVHRKLEHWRAYENREFFHCSIEEVKKEFIELIAVVRMARQLTVFGLNDDDEWDEVIFREGRNIHSKVVTQGLEAAYLYNQQLIAGQCWVQPGEGI